MSHAIRLHDGTGQISVDPAVGILEAYGATVPTDATPGFAPGCHFIHTDGSGEADLLYVNMGTKLSSNFDAVDFNIAESAFLSGVTAGTVSASKAVVVDANKDISAFRNLGAAGTVTSTGPTSGVGYATGAGGAVTQITSASTGVTLSKVTGQITTVALTTAAAAEERFTVTNTAVAATDVIVLGTTYNGAGTPMLSVQKIASGAFDVVITNVHAANALDALMVINFAVIKGVAA